MNARRFLQELLADGPHRASEIYELAEDAGIAERTLKRAKGDLGVVSEKQGDGWWWRRPAEGDREGSDDDASDEGELS